MILKILLVCCLSLGCNNKSPSTKAVQDTTYLYQHWIHSYEEDEKDKTITTYRPKGYPFPPARGREGFEFQKNGVFMWYPIAAGDGNSEIKESWELKDGQLIIRGKDRVVKYKIISLAKDKLMVSSSSQ